MVLASQNGRNPGSTPGVGVEVAGYQIYLKPFFLNFLIASLFFRLNALSSSLEILPSSSNFLIKLFNKVS